MYIENINGPADVKKLNIAQMTVLASEMRDALLTKLSRHGGHFGPNFGMVEATIALHYVFESPKDKFVFDVSHQSYPHKMLTGRKDAFLYEEHYDDVSGYSSPHESEHDHFTIGHTSTSVSLACGLAKGRDLKGEDGNVVAIIGDGSLSGGEALEALDYAAELDGNLIILVNDNDMSIAENHGGLYQNLRLLRETGGKAECNLFRAMGLDYRFVADGNDIASLIEAFKAVKDSTQPVVVHIVTQKGKGYAPAEQHKEAWHYCAPFHPETGEPLMDMSGECYESITLDFMMKKMQADPSVCMITSGTPTVLGFTEEMRKKAGRQFIDVGIAEENAVALASGIAANGGKPVYGVYSTFIQRAYDQIVHDVCLQKLPVKLCMDRAGLVGDDGPTHHGVFDYAYLLPLPNMVIMAPKDEDELRHMLKTAMTYQDGPIAMRYPRGNGIGVDCSAPLHTLPIGKAELLSEGRDVSLWAIGSMVPAAVRVADALRQKGIDAGVVNMRFAKPLDAELLEQEARRTRCLVTLEEGVLKGGVGDAVLETLNAKDLLQTVRVLRIGIPDEFVPHGDRKLLLRDIGMDDETMTARIAAFVQPSQDGEGRSE